MNIETNLETTLDHLLNQRRFGAIALRGFKYQLLYSLFCVFDLFSDNTKIDQIRFEGVEDVDLAGLSIGKHFIQVKSSSKAQGIGWLTSQHILDKFIEVYKIDNHSRFSLVKNFKSVGEFDHLVDFLSGRSDALPHKTMGRLQRIAEDNQLTDDEMQDFISRVEIVTIEKDELINSIEARIIKLFDITSGNEGLYFLAMFAQILDAAVDRKTLKKVDIVNILSQIETWISRGKSNPAIEQGLIEKLSFQEELNTSGYYSGIGARPSHILANLDAKRPNWIEEIDKTINNNQVTVVRASSGQGKSTLLYRYAFTFHERHSIYVLRNLSTSEQLTPVEQFLRSQCKLGIPLLVLIDDLNNNVQYWHELATRLAGVSVSFLVASREENWFRYSGSVQNLQWASVFPTLSIQEAKEIFNQFKADDSIASNVTSAEWAYEQVSDKKLLIEFVFLITQGQMLSARLAEQVKTIHHNQEDPAKINVLRLVSLGQMLDIRITLKNIMAIVNFRQDPEMVIRSMQGEYIELSTDGYIEGLHFVRSEHLVPLLHQVIPLESTLGILIENVHSNELPILALNMFSFLDIDDTTLLTKLVKRTTPNCESILATVRSLFQADEYRYLLTNRQIADTFLAEFGSSAFRTFFANANKPFQNDFDAYEAVKNIPNSDHDKLERMETLTDDMPNREENILVSKSYLRLALKDLSSDDLLMHLSATANLSMWANYFDLDFNAFISFIQDKNWIDKILAHNIDELADFLFAVWRLDESSYFKALKPYHEEIRRIFKSSTKTIWIEERHEGDLYIEFIVDEELPIHAQAMTRIETIWKLFPTFDKYSSQGLYPITDIERLVPDESHKSIARTVLEDRIPAEVNSQYISVIERLAVTNAVLYEWIEKWQTWRMGILEFIKEATKRHEKEASGKRYDGKRLANLWNSIRSLVNNPPSLPDKFKISLSDEESSIKDWHKSVGYFLNAYVPSPSSNDEHKKRLSILNLQETISHLHHMQQAFATIRQRELSFYADTISTRDEKETYEYLWNLLQYVSSEEQNSVRNRRVSVRVSVKSWIDVRRQAFDDELERAFQPILQEGWVVYLPSDYLYERLLKSVCFAVEITSINPIIEQLSPALYGITQTKIDYDFIYVIPVVNQKRVFSYGYRASKRTVDEVANGTFSGNKIGIFPIDIPQGVNELIAELSCDMLAEGQLLFEFSRCLGTLEALRKEVFLISSKLSKNEQDIKDNLFEGIRERLDSHLETVEVLLKKGQQFSNAKGSVEWNNTIVYVRNAIEKRKNEIFSIENYTPTPLVDDLNLLSLFDQYLTVEYFS